MTRAATEAGVRLVAMGRVLRAAGWIELRTPHEPIWWRDPRGWQAGGMRTAEAYELLLKRRRGLERHSRDTQRKDGK